MGRNNRYHIYPKSGSWEDKAEIEKARNAFPAIEHLFIVASVRPPKSVLISLKQV